METRNNEDVMNDVEELYARPYKNKPAQSVTSNGSEGIYDRLDRQNSTSMHRRDGQTAGNISDGNANGNQNSYDGDKYDGRSESHRTNQYPNELEAGNDTASVLSYQRSLTNQSMLSGSSGGMQEEKEKYQVEVLETKDTKDIVKELSHLGLEGFSDRLILALRNRFELESAFIEVCANDNITIVEGDSDETNHVHSSIGGLRVKGMKPRYVNYDEYDPDVVNKYKFLAQELSKEKLANDAAELRRRAANMLWAVENMERMIDPNSRVRYVRQEGDNDLAS